MPVHSAAIVFLAALAVYLRTLAPTVTLVDSGELIVAARFLGVAHPPGFPLYTLLAHAATWLPLGNVAERVNFFSALCAALAAGLAAAVVVETLWVPVVRNGSLRRSQARTRNRKIEAAPHKGGAEPSVMLTLVPALVTGLLLAFSRTLWGYATIAEVYALNTALLLGVLLLMFRWRRGKLDRHHATDRWLYAAAFVFGLGLGVHHVTVALTLPALAVLVYSTAGTEFFMSRRLAWAALCAFAGLAIYAYLPLAAARAPLLNWGDPRTLQRVWWHVTGRQYQTYFSFAPGELGGQAVDFIRRAGREFGLWWCPVWLALVLVGFATLSRRDGTLFVFLVVFIATNLAYGLTYVIAEDKDAYYLPSFMAAAIAAGYGASWLLHATQRVQFRHARAAAGIALLLVPLVALAGNFRFNDRGRYFIAHDYVENILKTVEPGGLLFTLDWQVYSPLLYLRSIEGERRDVTAIDVNLLRRSWYFDYLRREYPRLMADTHEQVDAFLVDLRQWEQDPQLYARDIALNRRIDTRFHEMLMAFVSERLRTAPVYVTQDIALNTDPQNRQFAQELAAAYQYVPQGLVFQIVTDRGFHEPANPQLVTRGLADGTLHFEADDVVRLKVLPVYVSMLYNRGRYLNLYGRRLQAVRCFKQALALDPTFIRARVALAAGQAPSPHPLPR